MASPEFNISALTDELTALIKALPAFNESGYSIFSIDDLNQQDSLGTFPMAGVMYEGCAPSEGNKASASDQRSHSALLLDVQFSVIIAVQYNFAPQDDTKRVATDLLNQTRKAILGYVGTSGRPWKFVGEKPEVEASTAQVVYYSQVWRTAIMQTGSFSNA